jgi:hypothetical protein
MKAPSPAKPLKLNGCFLTQVQELQASGHGRVGFVGVDAKGTQVQVPKPKDAHALPEDEDKVAPGMSPAVRISLPGLRKDYPFTEAHVHHIKQIATFFVKASEE